MCPDHVTDQQIRLLSTLPCRRCQRTAKIFPLVRTYPRYGSAQYPAAGTLGV